MGAQEVVANDDLLYEILRHLPARSLFRFKSVSKRWLSLITTIPIFSLYNNPDPSSVSGLFLHPTGKPFLYIQYNNPILEFIHLKDKKAYAPIDHDAQFRSPISIPSLSHITILSSCHGILLCYGKSEAEEKLGYHILNPTTKQLTKLPQPHLRGLLGLSLAFDPSKSPHYRVICVWCTHDRRETDYRIEIYSSETRSWRASGDIFTTDAFQMSFRDGAYWNGAVHWLCDSGDSLYFNVEQEQLRSLPMPADPENKEYYDREFRGFWESREHLHIVDIYADTPQFDVYELERDYSGWFVKYRIDLSLVPHAFPEMKEILNGRRQFDAYSVLCLVREEDDEESFMVLHIPGKIISYNLVHKTFNTLRDEGVVDHALKYYRPGVYPYIESYSCV